MKRSVFILFLMFPLFTAWSQESGITLSGGYTFGKIEDFDEKATGYRINFLYEFNPNEGNLYHGVSLGFIHTSATMSSTQSTDTKVKVNNFPVYYAPKYAFGQKGRFQPFLKGAIGFQASGLDVEGPLSGEVTSGDFGFYGGLGAGIMKDVSDKMFLNLEYEWAYVSNSVYKDGFLNNIMLGVGIKF